MTDDFGLFVDFLDHEMAVIALIHHQSGADRGLLGSLDWIAISVIDSD